MQRSPRFFRGEHDFSSFAASTRKGMENRVVVERAEWRREGDELHFEIKANRFVHRMVRNLVGTMVEVGRGSLPAGRIPEILEARDRTVAGPSAPAQGLFLVDVFYESESSSPVFLQGGMHEVLS